jgi:hypothetical protein
VACEEGAGFYINSPKTVSRNTLFLMSIY